MASLDIHLGADLIGTLEKTRKGARLRFSEAAVEKYLGRPLLSTSLPVKHRPYAEGLTGAWFENLLPEGDRLTRLCRELHCAPDDYFHLLEKIGWECAGAVAIMPSGYSGPGESKVAVLSEAELSARLRNLPTYDAEESVALRVSLGGYQEKMIVAAESVAVKGGYVSEARFGLPQGTALSTHILKPQLTGKYPGLIEAEAWAMAVASAAARCAETALMRLEGAPLTLAVRRFDRASTPDGTIRLHQEDCCQALGLPPSDKYASASRVSGDDPTYRGIAQKLSAYALNARREISELLRQLVVNLVLGNVDAHAKNHAFLYAEACSPQLSPLYDVVPVRDIEPEARHLSLRINGKILASEVSREDVEQEAALWGLTASEVGVLLDETLASLEVGFARAAELYPTAAERLEASSRSRLALLS